MPRQEAMDAIDSYLDVMIESFRNQKSLFEGFRVRDLHILAFVDREHDNHEVTITELANHLKISPAAASQIVTMYEKKEWLVRRRSKTDRRTVYISLADGLRTTILNRKENLYRIITRGLSQFTDDELNSFAHVLSSIDQSMRAYQKSK